MKVSKNVVALAIMGSFILGGCSSTDDSQMAEQAVSSEAPAGAVKLDFSDPALQEKIVNTDTSHSIDGSAVNVVFEKITKGEANSKWPNIRFKPASGTWDWSSKQGLKLKLENPGQEQVRVEIKISDNMGIMGAAAHMMDLPIYLDAGSTSIVEVKFNGTELGLEDYRGGKSLNLKKVNEVQFYSVGPIAEQTVIVHDIDFL